MAVLVLNAEVLDRIATELTFFIGPVASRLVHSVATRVSTLADLCGELASHIPSEQDRQKFLERVRRAAPGGQKPARGLARTCIRVRPVPRHRALRPIQLLRR
jgi:hypothetical protein